MRLSLRYRMLLPLTLLLLGDAAATAWAADTAARSAERRLAAQQWAVAHTLTAKQSQFRFTKPILDQMKGLSGAEFLFVPPEGRPSVLPESTFEPMPVPPADVPVVTLAEEAEEHTLGSPVQVAGTEYRCLRLRIVFRPHPYTGGDLYIFYPESLRQTAVRDAVQPLLILGGVGGLGAFALAVAFGSSLVTRIRDLDARTRLIAAGDFRPMPLPRSDDELRDLCESVNDMARRLAAFQEELQRDERLRVLGQFSGGLAHQLRNAAAGAKLAIELFLAENPTADPEPLRVALRQLARIEANLRQFLVLGKPPQHGRQPCDLVKLLDQAVSLLKPQCQHAGTELVWNPSTEACVISGDPTQLSHLFGNVIGNAVEAAGSAGTVTVSLAATGSGPGHVIEVTDTGAGPPPDIAERLFEPFVTGKDQGIGLGLAVAKQAAEAHGGRLSWERRDGKTVFRIELPG
ncbi:MAG: HAMP domain-containing histidine kinase [Planctomycetes bacterium]|nr:HAMP domain-containing histidine kinase [Planctomycetota bacterium]